jgi:hypothetical protein
MLGTEAGVVQVLGEAISGPPPAASLATETDRARRGHRVRSVACALGN